ncbi:tRNA-intron endonuclease catalytic domain-like protein [Gonapodya prolifera JEL478]|uniref:tRNA-splicing endonuclease subunit Sen2 n=1 Tax=Gonapodya prolifera (strain JEL478) TaxID=1344416 RepID=A0A139AB28_GONPJ|nr:tRNA-intron endonuclease catalytic domain-like protein [Gonapodya prolifera JEL478]|eukprot:KXS13947.1 tRNA-intron endonuclease catalytic domain-like protein [Gonapodya prolifera JEL478]
MQPAWDHFHTIRIHFSYLISLLSSASPPTPRGLLVGAAAWVTSREDATRVWTEGHFGKGTLHRSEPEYIIYGGSKPRRRRKESAGTLAVDVDPATVAAEILQLSGVETMFLAAQARLNVEDNGGNLLSSSELWAHFTAQDPRFPLLYAVYKHYRKQGWVVRSGAVYAADYVLYRTGPAYDHSEFVVTVLSLETGTISDVDEHHSAPHSLFNLSRMSFQVKKDVLVCFVGAPKGPQPWCDDGSEVREVVVRRWLPERAR